jgi:hypothetical protein
MPLIFIEGFSFNPPHKEKINAKMGVVNIGSC